MLQGKAADILHTVPPEATFQDIMGALRDHFGDRQLAAANQSQLKARVTRESKLLRVLLRASSGDVKVNPG